MNQNKFEVFLQPFSEKMAENSWLEFSCTHCKETVKVTPKVQKEMCYGGAGHKCPNCDTYYAFISCPACKNIVGFDDKEWVQLSEPDGVSCSSCDAVLFRNKENWRPILGGYSAIYPNLNNWSSSEREKLYLANIVRSCTEDQKKAISIRHHSVGVRMGSSESALQYLESNTWYSPLTLSNSSISVKNTNKTPFDNDFHENLFSFINNLRSALDILSQEVATVYNTDFQESQIDFQKKNRFLNNECHELHEYITHFQENETYIYLNKLRNVLQHRRIPVMVTVSDYETKKLDSIKAVSIHSIAIIKLPDNPYDNSEEYVFNNNIEALPYIRKAFDESRDFILGVYSKLLS